jgi:MOSC domain-containing protein YiiM
LKLHDCSPAAARRNVITRGVDLNELIGREFEVQGVCLYGTEECRPCNWMDGAFAPRAHEFLKGRGGLRAKILTDGPVRSTAQLPLAKADEHLAASPFARERGG